MKLRMLSEHDVRRLLSMQECIGVMEDAFRALGNGEVHNPLRQIIRAPGAAGLLGLMPAWRGGERSYYAVKEVCVYPGNPARGLDTHLGAVILHDGENGVPLAILNAAAITEIRTAAVSALATRLLAREESRVLAIIGAGAQARSHLEAIPLVRPVEEIRIYSRSPERVRALVAGLGRDSVVVCESVREAVAGADIIVTATSSKEPILERWLVADGVHLNAVGSSIASARELDGETVRDSSLFVDRRESTLNESGDYLLAARDGLIGPDHIRGELGELLTGRIEGRRSATEITLFKSLGLAIEDLMAAAFLYEKTSRMGGGQNVEF